MGRHPRRLLFFTFTLLAGLAIGLTYGWVVDPVRYTNTPAQTLRIDFKADFILMTAELYQDEGDITLAQSHLDFLDETDLSEALNDALDFAVENQYAQLDIQSMEELASAIELHQAKSE